MGTAGRTIRHIPSFQCRLRLSSIIQQERSVRLYTSRSFRSDSTDICISSVRKSRRKKDGKKAVEKSLRHRLLICILLKLYHVKEMGIVPFFLPMRVTHTERLFSLQAYTSCFIVFLFGM